MSWHCQACGAHQDAWHDTVATDSGERPCDPKAYCAEHDRLKAEVERLRAALNTPEFIDFSKAVTLEAAHQLERWGSDHDAVKTDADWLWLLGYLAGKALHNPGVTPENATEKKLHRIVTVAAAACNWHARVLGESNMRPGIEEPKP